MNINNVKNILKVYGENTPLKSVKKNAKETAYLPDEVVLSTQAQNFRQVLQLAEQNRNEVRMEKVKSIAKQIDQGTYSIDARLIAEKMLNARY